ncbi:MAG: SpoIIIAC/SpoIIIAD family protein [Lachnospira pectinoschiza]
MKFCHIVVFISIVCEDSRYRFYGILIVLFVRIVLFLMIALMMTNLS